MSISEIVASLCGPKGATAERVQKAKGQAVRSKVEWSAVVASMTPEQRALVEGL